MNALLRKTAVALAAMLLASPAFAETDAEVQSKPVALTQELIPLPLSCNARRRS